MKNMFVQSILPQPFLLSVTSLSPNHLLHTSSYTSIVLCHCVFIPVTQTTASSTLVISPLLLQERFVLTSTLVQ